MTNEEGSPGQGWGYSSGHCPTKGQSGGSAARQRRRSQPGDRQASVKDSLPGLPEAGEGRTPPGRLPGFLPSVATNRHIHLALNPSILGFSGHQQPEGEWCFILLGVNIFTFYERAGA